MWSVHMIRSIYVHSVYIGRISSTTPWSQWKLVSILALCQILRILKLWPSQESLTSSVWTLNNQSCLDFTSDLSMRWTIHPQISLASWTAVYSLSVMSWMHLRLPHHHHLFSFIGRFQFGLHTGSEFNLNNCNLIVW